MKGTILNFDQQAQSGLISAEDGKRYAFTQNDWKNTSPPKNGLQVDFTAEGDKAHEVYVSSRAPLSASGKKIPAALLAFFLGVFGVHKFYLGYKKQGIIMLLCTIPGIVLFGIPTVVISIVAFIEFIIYICKSDEDFDRTYVQGRKPWF